MPYHDSPLTTVALALEPQIVESVPVTGTDFTLDGIVTPSGVIMRST